MPTSCRTGRRREERALQGDRCIELGNRPGSVAWQSPSHVTSQIDVRFDIARARYSSPGTGHRRSRSAACRCIARCSLSAAAWAWQLACAVRRRLDWRCNRKSSSPLQVPWQSAEQSKLPGSAVTVARCNRPRSSRCSSRSAVAVHWPEHIAAQVTLKLIGVHCAVHPPDTLAPSIARSRRARCFRRRWRAALARRGQEEEGAANARAPKKKRGKGSVMSCFLLVNEGMSEGSRLLIASPRPSESYGGARLLSACRSRAPWTDRTLNARVVVCNQTAEKSTKTARIHAESERDARASCYHRARGS